MLRQMNVEGLSTNLEDIKVSLAMDDLHIYTNQKKKPNEKRSIKKNPDLDPL